MTAEITQLARNVLDDSPPSTATKPFMWLVSISMLVVFGGGIFIGFKIASPEEIFENVNTASTTTVPVVDTIVGDPPQQQSQQSADPTSDHRDEIYILASESTPGSLCEVGDMTAVEVIDEYSSCRHYSNYELDADGYELVNVLVEVYPTLYDAVASKMRATGKLTYIDKFELRKAADRIKMSQERTKLLQHKSRLLQ